MAAEGGVPRAPDVQGKAASGARARGARFGARRTSRSFLPTRGSSAGAAAVVVSADAPAGVAAAGRARAGRRPGAGRQIRFGGGTASCADRGGRLRVPIGLHRRARLQERPQARWASPVVTLSFCCRPALKSCILRSSSSLLAAARGARERRPRGVRAWASAARWGLRAAKRHRQMPPIGCCVTRIALQAAARAAAPLPAHLETAAVHCMARGCGKGCTEIAGCNRRDRTTDSRRLEGTR